MTVGFVGLGRMGCPMASNIARAGFDVVAFDLNPDAIAAVVEAGGRAAASAADAASQADVIFTMLPNSQHVQGVVEGEILPNLKQGGIVVDMSTIDPAMTDRVAQACKDAGCGFVDAPVGRSAMHADRGESLFMAGAEAGHLETVRPMLDAMGDTIVHCGGPGSGIRIKIVNNFLAVALSQLNAEALTLGAALGIDLETELKALNGTTATNGFLQSYYPAKTLAGDISPGFQIDLAHKDLSIALDAANRFGLPLMVGSAARDALNVARARGFGGKDFTGLFDALTDLVGIEKPLLKK
ncbi:MAG: NAD(P)-binding domain-containing protein [Novosphingobium sp.]|nr:NAD(P)-binding domain-containing protein [Novosphingobium sp.]